MSINSSLSTNSPQKLRFVSSYTSSKGIATIVGVGPKLGRSVACKFANEGYTIAILSRDLGTVNIQLSLISFFFCLYLFLLISYYNAPSNAQKCILRVFVSEP
jgi:hypothetical protein